ncbi:hypothetical protein P168DRAFT_320000 [Aspergillus campestris IBT 28561]|uniref:Non-classical export protein 1 n=1 Tax=Aspergillus campestris (strain IBT 28561) TaxID=1392248 RepID=A0A2I1CXS5_ASPC2|nr:uncharacterized protein P168DRAFT_320000 [Aspergillus campestris IBT 28561]PKY02428.1 hypothetical protein P168DRAFT_320000 [Aspergillus campestris IBT 28561]
MPVYLLSKLGDPLFAFTIGASAALLRIQRDQREKNPDRAAQIGMGSVLGDGGRRVQRWWRGDFVGL